MNSTLKIAIPLVLFVAAIFGLTIIATNTPPTPPPVGGPNDEEAPTGPALSFVSTKMLYSPDSEDLSTRNYPGVYEVSDAQVPISFWFQNPHKVPVKVSAQARSCAQCSAARVTVFPHDAMKDFQLRAAAGLPLGALGPPNLLLPLALTALLEKGEKKDLDFDHPDLTQEVPPRAADGTPTWGVLQLGIQVKTLGMTVKYVMIGLTPGKGEPQRRDFEVHISGAPPFTVLPDKIDLGEIEEGAPPRTFSVTYWTASREQADLPEPVFAGYDPKDPFFEVGKPVPMTADEKAALAAHMRSLGKTVPVTAGYKFTVTVHRRRDGLPGGPVEPDVGPFTRDIDVTGKGLLHSIRVPVSGTVVGIVGLTDKQNKIDLGSFKSSGGAEKVVTLASLGSDPAGVELEVARDKTSAVLSATLAAAPPQGSRKFWTLTVSASGYQGDLPADCAVVLRAKTKEGPRVVRIPVIGRGSQR